MPIEAKYKIFDGAEWVELSFPPNAHTHDIYAIKNETIAVYSVENPTLSEIYSITGGNMCYLKYSSYYGSGTLLTVVNYIGGPYNIYVMDIKTLKLINDYSYNLGYDGATTLGTIINDFNYPSDILLNTGGSITGDLSVSNSLSAYKIIGSDIVANNITVGGKPVASTEDLANKADYTTVSLHETKLSTLEGYFSNGIAKSSTKATQDSNGNNIVNTYLTKSSASSSYVAKKTTKTIYSTKTKVKMSLSKNVISSNSAITLTDSCQEGDIVKVYLGSTDSSYATYNDSIIEFEVMKSPVDNSSITGSGYAVVGLGSGSPQAKIISAVLDSATKLSLSSYTLCDDPYESASSTSVYKIERLR